MNPLVPTDVDQIPYTKPDDPDMEVTILPRHSKFDFEILTPEGRENLQSEFSYQFKDRTDLDIFQRQLRLRELLQIIPVVEVHTSKESRVAQNVHVKIWTGNEKNPESTISFARLGENKPEHHVEYIICWFKNEPERRGNERPRLLLYPNITEGTDLDERPDNTTVNHDQKSPTTKELGRKWSRDSIYNASGVLYDWNGKTAPKHVQELGYLEFEFKNVALREKFVNACFEAHSPCLYHDDTTPRPTIGSDNTNSSGANRNSVFSSHLLATSRITTPGNSSVSDLDAAGFPVELPSPAIPHHIPI
ncbi:hypothetical protein F4808DRAFT_242391 [Astrocystis sublimbata]|nr:hypothetical protein F4808DRAFT_242391 [Astrocystis sublimbata]